LINQRTEDWGLADQTEFEILDVLERLRQSQPGPGDFFLATQVFDDVCDKYRDKIDRSFLIDVMNRLLSDGLIRGVEHPEGVGLQISNRGRERLVELCAGQKEYSKKEETVRILFLAANPKDTDPLRLGEEAETIDERLRGAEFRDSFELISHWAVSSKKLSDYLLRHTPHIVHFAGHGSTLGKIVLEDETGNAKTVPPEALSRLFRILKDNIRCVVLNACLTEDQAEGIVQEIDCVVGMSREIDDVDAISFAGGFYRGLAYGRSVQTAFELGRNEIDLDSLGGGAIPILKVKPGVDPAKITFV
jgi:hypothetical protein